MDKLSSVKMFDVGVNVARFQIDELHEAHIELINIMLKTHKRLIIVFGLSPLECTSKNPLNLPMRKQAFIEKFRDKMSRIKLLYINNHRSDQVWSDNLDDLIKKNTSRVESIRYCGGRDSFLEYYTNTTFPIWRIDGFTQTEFISATQRRNEIASTTEYDLSFRRGVIHTANNITAQCVPSIDLAILDHYKTSFLMGTRVGETTHRFIGSWVRSRETFEDACHRTAKEKAGIEVYDLQPLKSFSNFDWKFKGERDDLTTLLYFAHMVKGYQPEPSGNISSLKWIPFADVTKFVDDEHRPMAIYAMHNIHQY